MPPAGYDFVVVSGHADGGQRLAEVSLQVRQDEAVVVASTQEVVSVRREPHRSDILKLEFWQCSSRDRSRFKSMHYLCVGLEGLHDPAPSDVVQDTSGVLVTGD